MAVTMSEDYGSPLPDEMPSSWDRLQRVIKNMPEALALVAMHQPAGLYGLPNVDLEDESYKQAPYLRWNYRTFSMAIDRLAAGLQAHGVRKGMPLITFLPNGAERLLAYFAANKLGCPFTPVSPKNLVNLEEVAHMVKVCLINATEDKIVFIAHDSSLTEQINTLPKAEGALKILVDGTIASDRWTNIATVFDSAKTRMNGAVVNGVAHVPNDEAIMFTSGSTSMPKGIFGRSETRSEQLLILYRLSMGSPSALFGRCWAGVVERIWPWRQMGQRHAKQPCLCKEQYCETLRWN